MSLTIKQLSEMNDKFVIILTLNERINKLTNQYTPYAQRLKKIVGKLERGDY